MWVFVKELHQLVDFFLITSHTCFIISFNGDIWIYFSSFLSYVLGVFHVSLSVIKAALNPQKRVKMQSCHHPRHLSDFRLTHLAKDLTPVIFHSVWSLHLYLAFSLFVPPLLLLCVSSQLPLMSTTCLHGTSQARPLSVRGPLCPEHVAKETEPLLSSGSRVVVELILDGQITAY